MQANDAPGRSHADGPTPDTGAGEQRPSAQSQAVKWLAQRELAQQALQTKLQAQGYAPEEVETALGQLKAKGLVSDERVVETLVNRRAGKLGASRLRQEMQAKGVDPDLVAQTMADLQDTEFARARAVWAKKFGQVAASSAERGKQARFLATRGFAADVVRQVVSGLPDPDEN